MAQTFWKPALLGIVAGTLFYFTPFFFPGFFFFIFIAFALRFFFFRRFGWRRHHYYADPFFSDTIRNMSQEDYEKFRKRNFYRGYWDDGGELKMDKAE